MKILLNYESSWRNSFLGGSNNEPLPSKGREFIGSMTKLKKPENFVKRNVTLDTVMGVLNRLIGDQRKLYQARDSQDYFFGGLEALIQFKDSPIITNEMTYIRNITGSTDQNSFSGVIKTNDILFFSNYSSELWGVLAIDLNQLCQFILTGAFTHTVPLLNDPLAVINRLELLDKDKPVDNVSSIANVVMLLEKEFPDLKYVNEKGMIKPISLYCSALYLQLNRLSEKYDMSSAKTKKGCISGISKKGFTKKDFMARFTSGAKKKIWGNPYIRKERIKGQGEIVSVMAKASGQLAIEICVGIKKGKEIKDMIENAGVSSFYLGKKGLAYVSKIRI